MKSTAKSIAFMRDLKDKLEFRFNGSSTIDTVREELDANGWPMLFLSDGGTETASNPVILLRIKGIDAVSKDIFGNSLEAFTPHVAEIAYELDGTGMEPSRVELLITSQEFFKLGIDKYEIKEITDATAVDETSLNAATVTETISNDVIWPNKGM